MTSLVLAIPTAMLALLIGWMGATNFNEYPDQIELAAKVDDVSFERGKKNLVIHTLLTNSI